MGSAKYNGHTVKHMSRGHIDPYPPNCHRCETVIEEGAPYQTSSNHTHTKYYHKLCKEQLYI